MFSLNFDAILNEAPNLAEAAEALKRWINRYPEANAIYADRFLRSQKKVSTWDFAELMTLLVMNGQLKRRFSVVDPIRDVLLHDRYDSIESIPASVKDLLGNELPTDYAEIVEVYAP